MESLPEPEREEPVFDAIQASLDNVVKLFGPSGSGASFSAPFVAANNIVITAAESFVFLGNGVVGGPGSPLASDVSSETQTHLTGAAASSGFGPMGGGGGSGGLSFSRPVAAITIGPAGVHVRPIIDWSKLGIAFLTTIGAMAYMLGRIARTPRRD